MKTKMFKNVRSWRSEAELRVAPLRAAARGRPLVAPAQHRSFRILGLCGWLVVMGDAVEQGSAALLHPLQIHHIRRHSGKLLGHADLRESRQAASPDGTFNTEGHSRWAELHTNCWLQIARSDTFPQPAVTTSKQRSGSQPNTRRQSVAPLYKQSPSGLKHTHLDTHTHTYVDTYILKNYKLRYYSPDRCRVSLHGADHLELLQVPQLHSPAEAQLRVVRPLCAYLMLAARLTRNLLAATGHIIFPS